MARARRTEPTTPQAKLNATIKSARDIMRKDAGLNGDLDRIPQLAWLLFLRAFDALEQRRELTERDYRPAIEEPYRWRDWAADAVVGRHELLLLRRQRRHLIGIERPHQPRRDEDEQLGPLGAFGLALEQIADDGNGAQERHCRAIDL